MQKGKNYLVGLDTAPTIKPKEGSWAQIRYRSSDRKIPVSPVLTTESWVGVTVVHIFALDNGPDPQAGQDELVYRDQEGNGESRTIKSFYSLDH